MNGSRRAVILLPLVLAVVPVWVLAVVAPVWADIVELRNGQRVEGTFKGADDTAVRIEVDGRMVTFPPGEVRAIYYGAAPPPSPSARLPERDEAIRALEALRTSAQTTGLPYPEYAARVREAQIAIDRYLRKEDGAPAVSRAVAEAFHFYELAAVAWNAGLSRGNYAVVGSDAALVRCDQAQQIIADSKRKTPFIWRSKGAGEAATTGMVIATEGIGSVWSCAADRLAEAEKLWAAKK